jgi:hypothetical protein
MRASALSINKLNLLPNLLSTYPAFYRWFDLGCIHPYRVTIMPVAIVKPGVVSQ